MALSVECLQVLCIALLLVAARGELAMVYSIDRHGARNTLPKTALLQESESLAGPTELPLGERQCWDAGQNFRARYIDPATCNDTCIITQPTSEPVGSYGLLNAGKPFNNYNTLLRSSYTDRAIISGLAFYSGIFPANLSFVTPTEYVPTGAQIVPVYTQPDENDWLIRAYTKCPTYDNVLLQWYASPEFVAKEQQSQDVRAAVQKVSPTTDVSLTNWWNVYDAFNTYRSYGVGDPVPFIDNTTWTEVQTLAYWLETAKMKTPLVKNYLGGPVVADMLSYMSQALSAVRVSLPEWYKLLSISSHYNVQLAVLAALKLDQHPPAVAALNWLNATLPQLASVVVFELHTPSTNPSTPSTAASLITGDTAAVRLVVQPGPNKTYVTVPMPCAAAGDAAEQLAGAGACTYNNFVNMAQPVALGTAQAWCSTCNNTQAADCAVLAAQGLLQGSPVDDGSSGTVSKSHYNTAIILSTVLTFFGTLALCALVFGCAYMRLKKRRSPYHTEEGMLKQSSLTQPMAL